MVLIVERDGEYSYFDEFIINKRIQKYCELYRDYGGIDYIICAFMLFLKSDKYLLCSVEHKSCKEYDLKDYDRTFDIKNPHKLFFPDSCEKTFVLYFLSKSKGNEVTDVLYDRMSHIIYRIGEDLYKIVEYFRDFSHYSESIVGDFLYKPVPMSTIDKTMISEKIRGYMNSNFIYYFELQNFIDNVEVDIKDFPYMTYDEYLEEKDLYEDDFDKGETYKWYQEYLANMQKVNVKINFVLNDGKYFPPILTELVEITDWIMSRKLY